MKVTIDFPWKVIRLRNWEFKLLESRNTGIWSGIIIMIAGLYGFYISRAPPSNIKINIFIVASLIASVGAGYLFIISTNMFNLSSMYITVYFTTFYLFLFKLCIILFRPWH